jgi:peptidoglycan-associated lipoprotein
MIVQTASQPIQVAESSLEVSGCGRNGMKRTNDPWKHWTLRRTAIATVLAVLVMQSACSKNASPTPPPPPPPAPKASLTANPQTIQRGQSSILTWSTENATEVTIDPIGRVAERGSDVVNPTQSLTYQLTAKGPGGATQASVSITVTEPSPSR